MADLDHDRDLGYPGHFPMTRGVYHTMYRGRLWTMRQFAGFGSPEETNARYQFLLAQGQGGLSVAFDMPTLMGRDSDDPRSEGEVGRCGVATDSLADFEALFDGIPLGDITTSMTISGPATILFAFFLAAAERQGVPWSRLEGTLQTDILKEYIAQKEWLFPPRPHLRLIGDLIEFCAAEVPKFHPISVSGYHIREAGSTAAQELAFTLADGFAYVELGQQRGLDVDAFAPGPVVLLQRAHRLLRGDREVPRRPSHLGHGGSRDRYGAKDQQSLRLRFHTQTAGCSLTAQQPENNIVRTADRGAGRGAGRDAVPAHQRPRRGAGPAHREGRPDRAADPAGDRVRDRRGQRDRPARRLVLRRGAHRPDGGCRRGVLRQDPGDGPGLDARGHAGRHRARATSSPRSPTPRSGSRSCTRRAG